MELKEQLELFEHTESDKVLNTIHTEVREKLRKCLDNDEMGSGTCGVACKNTNRKYILIEKDEKYFQIMKERLGIL